MSKNVDDKKIEEVRRKKPKNKKKFKDKKIGKN